MNYLLIILPVGLFGLIAYMGSAHGLFETPLFQLVFRMYDLMSSLAFIWAPILFGWLAQHLWLEYRQMVFIRKSFYPFILLEIKVPREINKTPLAMEIAMHAFDRGPSGNWWEKWVDGKCKPWFSLEIASLEGSVKFFIYTPQKFKSDIEANLFGQYPDVEIHEVKDYVSLAPYLHEPKDWEMAGCTFSLTKPDPYPIKTYVDYGLDSTQTKEEMKSDPISSIIEYMGGIGRGEYMWLQIGIQKTAPRFSTAGTWFGKHDWTDEGKKIVKELQEKYAGEVGTRATKRQTEVIQAIERSLGKPGFDASFRSIYVARKEYFDRARTGGIRDLLNPFGTQDLNGFRSHGLFPDYPWEDYNNILLNRRKRKLFDGYVRRSFFFPPYRMPKYVLNTEELATIFHFPGGVTETPTFGRIGSRKGEPPANLPI